MEYRNVKAKKWAWALAVLALASVWIFRANLRQEFFGVTATSEPNQIFAPTANANDTGAIRDARESTRSAIPTTGVAGEGMSTGQSSSLKWRTLVGERNTDWAIRQLTVSSNPDDWYRAVALSKVCVATASVSERVVDEAIKAESTSPSRYAEIAAVHAQARLQCAGNDTDWLGNDLLTDLLNRAKKGGSKLANAPQLSANSLRDGFSRTDFDALTSLFKDEELRSAWLLVNSERLARSIVDASGGHELKNSEVVAAIFETMCTAGDACGRGSIYLPALCAASSYEMCSTVGVGTAIASAPTSGNTQRVSTVAARIAESMRAGDLTTLGLKISN